LKGGLNALIQRYTSWYNITNNAQEGQFENIIGTLLQIIDDILNTTVNNHYVQQPSTFNEGRAHSS
jgi:hypothetical protein